MRKLITLGLLLSLLSFASLSAPTTAETSATTTEAFVQTATEFQYAAKFICGRTDSGLAAPGQYFTIVNLHNPSPNRTVEFRKKFARALPGEKVGKITPFFQAALRADEAMGIDCPDIYQHTNIPQGTFIEGYVVIHTRMELDVVSVYTAGHPQVETLHTERVPFRSVPVVLPPACGPLKLSLNTGVANWRITQDPDSTTTEPRAASIVTSPPSAWGSQSGAQWIGPKTSSGNDAIAGDYVYQFCFCLCSGFTNARLTLTGLADNSANVFINNSPTPLTPTIPGFSGTPTTVQTNNSQLFQAGTNCVKVVVRNNEGPTGLNIKGTVTANAGLCPPGTDNPVDIDTNVNPN